MKKINGSLISFVAVLSVVGVAAARVPKHHEPAPFRFVLTEDDNTHPDRDALTIDEHGLVTLREAGSPTRTSHLTPEQLARLQADLRALKTPATTPVGKHIVHLDITQDGVHRLLSYNDSGTLPQLAQVGKDLTSFCSRALWPTRH